MKFWIIEILLEILASDIGVLGYIYIVILSSLRLQSWRNFSFFFFEFLIYWIFLRAWVSCSFRVSRVYCRCTLERLTLFNKLLTKKRNWKLLTRREKEGIVDQGFFQVQDKVLYTNDKFNSCNCNHRMRSSIAGSVSLHSLGKVQWGSATKGHDIIESKFMIVLCISYFNNY